MPRLTQHEVVLTQKTRVWVSHECELEKPVPDVARQMPRGGGGGGVDAEAPPAMRAEVVDVDAELVEPLRRRRDLRPMGVRLQCPRDVRPGRLADVDEEKLLLVRQDHAIRRATTLREATRDDVIRLNVSRPVDAVVA